MSHVHGQSNRTIPIDDAQFKTIENVAFADHIHWILTQTTGTINSNTLIDNPCLKL